MTTCLTWFFNSTNQWNFDTLKNFGGISPIVQNHLKKVFITLCFAVAAFAFGAYVNVFLLNFDPLVTTIVCVGCSAILLLTPPFEEGKRLTLLMGVALFQGAFLGPFIYAAVQIEPSIIFSSSVATAIAFGCFSGAALAAKHREYPYIGGLVCTGLFILMLLHFTTSIYGDATVIVRFVLYLAHLGHVGFCVVDMQEMVEKAHSGDLDYVQHALTLFADLFAIFVRALVIMLKNSGDRTENQKSTNQACLTPLI